MVFDIIERWKAFA